VLGLAAATAGLGENELAVRLDAIQRFLMADAGIVYVPTMVERLGRLLELAHQAGVAAADTREPSLELALELLDQSTSIASPNE
jgi:hypothetical protein